MKSLKASSRCGFCNDYILKKFFIGFKDGKKYTLQIRQCSECGRIGILYKIYDKSGIIEKIVVRVQPNVYN